MRTGSQQHEYEMLLKKNLTLTQKYLLGKMSRTRKASARERQAMDILKISALKELPLFLNGQDFTVSAIVKTVTSHMLIMGNRPLVMVFAGPSGHGKTEVAKQMGALLSVESIVIDCAEMKTEMTFFGPKAPYQGSGEGSPLNNHLCRNAGKLNVVFLDEFEKSTKEVWEALLLILDQGNPGCHSVVAHMLTRPLGAYRDRRNGREVNTSKTIWVIATNAVDPRIVEFHKENLKDKSAQQQAAAPWKVLDKNLRKAMAAIFGVREHANISN